MRRWRTQVAALLVVAVAVGACSSGSDGGDTNATDGAGTAVDGSAGVDGGGGSSDDSGGVPMAADLLGAGFEGLYVGPEVRVEAVAEDPAVRRLRAPFGCDQLRAQLAAGNWEIVDRLVSTPTLESGGILDTLVLARGDVVAWVTFTGAADCKALVARAERTPLTFALPSGVPQVTSGWAVTSRCTNRDGVRVASVEVLVDDTSAVGSGGASFNIAIYDDGGAGVEGGIAGWSALGWLRALGIAYSDPLSLPEGGYYEIDGGDALVTTDADRMRGTVVVDATAIDMNGGGGAASFSFPFACTSVDDVSL